MTPTETVTISAVLSQLKSLELQVKALKAQVQILAEREGQPTHTFSDLHGRFPEFGRLGEEEIDEALYRELPAFEAELEKPG